MGNAASSTDADNEDDGNDGDDEDVMSYAQSVVLVDSPEFLEAVHALTHEVLTAQVDSAIRSGSLALAFGKGDRKAIDAAMSTLTGDDRFEYHSLSTKALVIITILGIPCVVAFTEGDTCCALARTILGEARTACAALPDALGIIIIDIGRVGTYRQAIRENMQTGEQNAVVFQAVLGVVEDLYMERTGGLHIVSVTFDGVDNDGDAVVHYKVICDSCPVFAAASITSGVLGSVRTGDIVRVDAEKVVTGRGPAAGIQQRIIMRHRADPPFGWIRATDIHTWDNMEKVCPHLNHASYDSCTGSYQSAHTLPLSHFDLALSL